MNRRQLLINEFDTVLTMRRKGSPSTKENHRIKLLAITDDLTQMNCLPQSWSELNNDTVKNLVACWKEGGNKNTTIANKLGLLRTLITEIGKGACLFDNNSTFIAPRKPLILDKLPELKLGKVEINVIKNIMDFEVNFGLTKTEAVKLDNKMLLREAEQGLTIYRTIAHNGKRRTVPINTDKQRQVIATRLGLLEQKRFAKSASLILTLYRATAAFYDIPGYLRRYYINNRSIELKKEHISKGAIVQTLQSELGITTKAAIRASLCHH